jgi:hypothetical protein
MKNRLRIAGFAFLKFRNLFLKFKILFSKFREFFLMQGIHLRSRFFILHSSFFIF